LWGRGSRNNRMNGWIFGKHGAADPAEYVPVELAQEQRFQGTPEESRMQVCPISRTQHDVSGIFVAINLVRTAERDDATFNPQALLDDLESQKMRRFNDGDALDQVASTVFASDRGPNASFIALCPHRGGKQRAEQERRAPGNFFIEHYVIPDRTRAGVEVKPRRNHFAHCIAREEPTHEPEPSCCLLLWPQRCRHRFSHLRFGVPLMHHLALPCQLISEEWPHQHHRARPVRTTDRDTRSIVSLDERLETDL
jgi:hypothetical protein